LEVIIFFAGIFVTIFSSIENGIYATISLSAAVLLFRVFKARGRFLGKVKVHSVVGDHLVNEDGKYGALGKDGVGVLPGMKESLSFGRDIFMPIEHQDGSNPQVEVQAPYPGIFIYRFSEGFNYPNANHYLDHLTDFLLKHTRRTTLDAYGKLGDRPWNDPGPRRGKAINVVDSRPVLRAVILDFSSVNNVVITSVQNLIDVRNQLDRYTAPDTVEWHMASINNRWTKRALASAGFGFPNPAHANAARWKPIFSVAEIGGSSSAAEDAQRTQNEKLLQRQRTLDHDEQDIKAIDHVAAATDSTGSPGSFSKEVSKSRSPKIAIVHSLDRPFFHVDLMNALQSAIANVEYKLEYEKKGGAGIGEEP